MEGAGAVVAAWWVRLRDGRHPEQHRLLSRESLAWVWRHRALTPGYLVRYLRLARLRLLHPDVVVHGLVLLGRGVRVRTVPGYGRIHLGAFVHLGERTVLRAHEGTLRIGDKVVTGADVRVTAWLDVEVGEATLLADWVYVADFDHVHSDTSRAVKDQGIRKGPVRIGAGSWLGLRSAVLRGTDLGRGTVVAAHAVVRGTFPDDVVLAGAPARVVADRADRAARRAAGPARPGADLLADDPARGAPVPRDAGDQSLSADDGPRGRGRDRRRGGLRGRPAPPGSRPARRAHRRR
ncbi:acyltransferase [Aquipuribacter sp. SD81]|uniref:acyltransferase n=1 Tax=Aquipuribacter sp. SD81 TaxID=3127703 RepID=UPI0030199821